ncbi:MAG: Proprotein convertase subtilisin/kexin type 7 [uncultured Sulfurovum sp.]|uniref:Proprotein convertase subtilisin/kexin type 7 n=1 Tax=uncultured Sulfurovum sp. TaxID=269237 RepID=A0A6S6UB06_9BACT|nr:MAG: Proprotein convertase subtilisin/kexin type 7 [uncultured Sulfurovum sp.]
MKTIKKTVLRYLLLVSVSMGLYANTCPKWFPMPAMDGLVVVIPIYDEAITEPDLDCDEVIDSVDTDIDGDGVANGSDSFPLNPSEWADSDGDGVGDNTDKPSAHSQSVTVDEDTNDNTIILSGSDDSSSITFSILTQPFNGTLGGIAPNITYTPNADYAGTDSFTFKVNDGDLDSAVATVNITINDVIDVPILENFVGSIEENATAGSFVGQINIVDSGTSDITAITLSGIGNTNFEVSTDGNITVKVGATLDYEMTIEYNLTVVATNTDGESTAVKVDIAVTDIADVTPILSDFSASIAENVAVGTEVGTVTVTSVGDSAITAFTLSDSTHFEINASGMIKTKTTFDYETTTEYNLTVTATNSAGESTAVKVDIAVTDIADVTPILSDFSASIAENVAVGTEVGTVTVTSVGDSAITAFTLSDSTHFEINASGTIKTKTTFDYETTTEYNLTVTATNSAGEGAAMAVDIAINNIAESVPVLAETYNRTIGVSSVIGLYVTTIYLDGSNIDENTASSFSIVSGNTNGDFNISSDGIIRTVHTLSHSTSSYTLEIIASNSVGDSTPVNQTITIEPNSIPTASDFNITLDVNESTIVDWYTRSSAMDADGNTLTASVKTQGTYGIFSVTGNSLSYVKTIGTNETDMGVLEITDGIGTIEINVSVTSLSWQQIELGQWNTVATKSNGALYVWGWNAAGFVGDGTTIDRHTPTRIGTATNWRSVSKGHGYTLAINNAGELYAWGYNSYGQLGDGTTTNRDMPIRIGSATNWTSVGAGSKHALAINSDGELYAWGGNWFGQVGDGTTTHKYSPTRIGTATNWVSVSGGYYHSIAINSDGELYAWGYGGNGQLGTGGSYDRHTPWRIGTATNWSIISAGYAHNVAINSDGELYTWGSNDYGQLGDGTTEILLTPTHIGTETNWNSVSAGMDHTLAINSNEELYAWGGNENGQLGDGNTTNIFTPTRISPTINWKSVSAGGNYQQAYTAAISSIGVLYVWGNNDYGQLGDGTLINKTIPTPIGN